MVIKRVRTEKNQIRPLTHCNIDGVPYQRTAGVNAQIESAIDLGPVALGKRARISDKESPDYIKEESLVYFIREYHRLGDEVVVNELAEVLLTRCAKRIRNRLEALPHIVIDEAYQDVVEAVFQRILDLESDRADFMEVRFWKVLKSLTINIFRKYTKQLKREKNVDNFSSLEQTLSNNVGEDAPIFEGRVSSSDLSVEDSVLLREALGILEEPYRTALLLRNDAGWPIESKDPDMPTISEYFDKTPRTIRNWFVIAESQLKEWRDERNEDE